MSDRFRVSIVALLTLAVVLFLYLPSANAAPPPSCQGPDACNPGNTGTVAGGACIGERSCFDNSGDISRDGCHGSEACIENEGGVGVGACHGAASCADNRGGIRKAACIGVRACSGNSGDVGEAACSGFFACGANEGDIGKLACRGDEACFGGQASVGEGACVGTAACARTAPGAIGRGACIGASACEGAGSVGPIGTGACRGERACANNPGPVLRGDCVGPPVNGMGVCEGAPAIELTSLEPDSCDSGSPDLEVVVHGTNFLPVSFVRWNGGRRTTTFESSTRLRAIIPASDLALPTTEAFIDVADFAQEEQALALQEGPRRVSNPLRFTVR